MNWGKMNLLKNYTFCRTVSLRFEAFHKLLLTLVCNWLKFIAIVFNCLFSLTVGQKTIPKTHMFWEEVKYSKGHCFLFFQILRPSNLVFWRLIRELVQSSKDLTIPHIRLMSSSHLTNKNWSATWPPTMAGDFHARQFLFESEKQRLDVDDVQKHRQRAALFDSPFENFRLAKRTIKYNSGLRSLVQRLHPSNGCWRETESHHCLVQEPSVDAIVCSRKIKTYYCCPGWYRLRRLRFRFNLHEQIPNAN